MSIILKSKSVLNTVLIWLAALVGFIICLAIPGILLPLPKNIIEAAPAAGFLPQPLNILVNGAVNAALLLWIARRSGLKGIKMLAQLTFVSFGVQVFMTQIETAYFIKSFPLLQGNFELYHLILNGLITSLLFSLLVTLLSGGFSKKPGPKVMFNVDLKQAVRNGAWLGLLYTALYFLFGYFVAWQFREVRLFYGGPVELNSFINQLAQALMERPEIPVFQYFRGILWLLCLVPIFTSFTGKRLELIILSALTLALLPTVQLAFPNPLMPAGVSFAHFIEVAVSTGIFGALCAGYVPAMKEEE